MNEDKLVNQPTTVILSPTFTFNRPKTAYNSNSQTNLKEKFSSFSKNCWFGGI